MGRLVRGKRKLPDDAHHSPGSGSTASRELCPKIFTVIRHFTPIGIPPLIKTTVGMLLERDSAILKNQTRQMSRSLGNGFSADQMSKNRRSAVLTSMECKVILAT
jgi:hypothetical protein